VNELPAGIYSIRVQRDGGVLCARFVKG
jgi:hypothetical protein